MAIATVKSTGVIITLELDEAEAEYVLAALMKADPAWLETDTVYEALVEAGVDYNPAALEA